MNSILKELYHGMIHPEEEYQPTEEIRQRRQAIDECQQNLLEKVKEIDPELGGKIGRMIEEENRAGAMEMEEAYIQGMRMGARLALALLENRKA